MGAVGGVVAGVLGLSALEAIASSSQASGRLGSLFTGTAAVISHLASPDVPLIPDLRTSSGAAASPTSAPAPLVSIPALQPSARLPVPLSA